jgi:ADP-heptose:LPS heptosyltransferase
MDESMHFTKDAVFIGSPDEHELFQRETGIVITFVKVKDMLDMANIIAGADAFVGNQGLSLALATGLGKTCVVEKRPTQYLDQCETYWKRDNMFYF